MGAADAAAGATLEDFDFTTLEAYDGAERLVPAVESVPDFDRVVRAAFEHYRGHRDELPAFPALASRLMSLVSAPDPEVNEIVKMLSQDPAITAQVLRVANSTYYARGHEVVSIKDAVMRLGLKEVARVATAASSRALFDPEVRAGHQRFKDDWHRIWQSAMTTAYSAAWLANDRRRGEQGQAFLAGMLHDIGKSITLRSLSALILAGQIRDEVVTPVFVATLLEEMHVDLGGEMAVTWDLPQFIAQVCLDHHSADLLEDSDYDLLHVVRVVSAINEIRANRCYRAGLESELVQSAGALGLDPSSFARVCGEVVRFSDRAMAMFSKTT